MDQGPKFQGSLEKQGKLAKGWKKYWFILKDSQLTYVKSQEKISNQGHIDMSQAQSVRSVNTKSGHQFEIVTRSRTHNLSSDSSEQRDKWVKVLHDAMAWYSRRNSSNSSISRLSSSGNTQSIRASCNSIEDEDYGYGKLSLSPTGSPSRSSGYSTDDATGDTTQTNGKELRDSTSDMMYNNPGYVKSKRISAKTAPTLESDVVYEDIQDMEPRNSKPQLRRLQPSLRQSRVESKADSMLSTYSDASDIYDSVHEPVHLAISHIVKGYASIPTNKGPQSEEEDLEDEEKEDDYDDVFVDNRISTSSSVSSVIMRKSGAPRDSDIYCSIQEEPEPHTDPPYATVSLKNKTKPPKPPKPPKPSIRDSALPPDMDQIFDFKPVNDLEHPRLELTNKTSFNDIRMFLANNRTRDEYYVKEDPLQVSGKGVRALKEYLASHPD